MSTVIIGFENAFPMLISFPRLSLTAPTLIFQRPIYNYRYTAPRRVSPSHSLSLPGEKEDYRAALAEEQPFATVVRDSPTRAMIARRNNHRRLTLLANNDDDDDVDGVARSSCTIRSA